MYAILEDSDRVVLKHEVPLEGEKVQYTVVVTDTSCESSYVLWRNSDEPEGQWHIMWRGDIKPVMDYYNSYVTDLELELSSK